MFRNRFAAGCAGLLMILCLQPVLMGATMFGPVPYLSSDDVPDGFYLNAVTELEDFEDGSLTPNIRTNAAVRLLGPNIPPHATDSVDGDDGVIDGFGLNGQSLFCRCGSSGITLVFPEGTRAAGLVWTDGYGTVTFEAFGPSGSLGAIRESSFVDSTVSGTTGEDRFFGVVDPEGITSVRISNSIGGIEIDHVQYELIPEPTSALLMLLGICGVGLQGFRRSRLVTAKRRQRD